MVESPGTLRPSAPVAPERHHTSLKILAGRDRFLSSSPPSHQHILPKSVAPPTLPALSMPPRPPLYHVPSTLHAAAPPANSLPGVLAARGPAGILSPPSPHDSPKAPVMTSLPHTVAMQPLTTPPGSPGGAGSSDEGALLAGATDDGAVRVSCEVCGKLYKNIGSYHNHRWEHRYGWDLTRQYAKTKKDRVELMEGAALLMNVTAVTGVSGAL